MGRNDSTKKEYVMYISEYDAFFSKDGKVFSKETEEEYPVTKEFGIGYRDEGPDAWANTAYFDGPAWVWLSHTGWVFHQKDFSINGYYGLNATIVTFDDEKLNVTKCYGEEY